jgi:hypothetical protein
LAGMPFRPSWHRPLWSGSPAHSRSDAFSPPPNSKGAASNRELPPSAIPMIEIIE